MNGFAVFALFFKVFEVVVHCWVQMANFEWLWEEGGGEAAGHNVAVPSNHLWFNAGPLKSIHLGKGKFFRENQKKKESASHAIQRFDEWFQEQPCLGQW
jgi:hypothetical protein